MSYAKFSREVPTYVIMMECITALKLPCPLFYAIAISMLCLVTVESLECYQCASSDEDSCTATTTCSSGQICSNEVTKRYTLTTLYDKGCISKSNCYSLENLNTDRYCSTTPSSCTYCCGSNLCNGAESSLVSKNSCLSLVMAFQALRFFVMGQR